MARNTFNIVGIRDISFYYNSFSLKIVFFKELCNANLNFRIFKPTEDLKFRCGFYFFNDKC